MRLIQTIGLTIFTMCLLLFIFSLSMSNYKLTQESFTSSITNTQHQEVLTPALADMMNKDYASKFAFINDFNGAFNKVNEELKANEEWNKVMYANYTFPIVKNSSIGPLNDLLMPMFIICFILSCIGALMYILPKANDGPAGIKHNHIFFSSMKNRGAIGIITGTLLILFYIYLYKKPEYITNWVLILDPLSYKLNGGEADQWFLYGVLYCLAMVVMGIRMLMKYRHSKYQQIRTYSVIFFQLAFAFTIPQILKRLNMPSYDLKSAWPLEYTFFFDYRLDEHIQAGTIGLFMIGWGIALFLIGVPLFTYLFGKRWYCSWVCGCGGLAETFGDPYRQLSDKSLKAWQIERWLVHAVLVFAVIMTAAVAYHWYSGEQKLLGIDAYKIRDNYGFMIGFVFAGVVGTGFYPLMGNRMWCRFGCPLAAYLGMVQKFKSRFRITTNGGQCISCGNCSTYCEMGIDVKWYAQRGQNIIRSSCVGCGVCSAVCPRGVLNLENADEPGRYNEPITVGKDGWTIQN
ncbi:MAG: 4Fe-4S binding protein [Bacteroidia bacterium]|nr:4Fe-4S binding protein [Bacteroidia bacterium]